MCRYKLPAQAWLILQSKRKCGSHTAFQNSGVCIGQRCQRLVLNVGVAQEPARQVQISLIDSCNVSPVEECMHAFVTTNETSISRTETAHARQ